VGSKAATLALLQQHGFPVPRGFVISSEALRSGGDDLPAGVIEAVRRILTEFGDQPLAVRSSAAAEDLGDSSFAGMFDTVLDVVGERALERAVTRVRRSAEAREVEEYRDRMGVCEPTSMAVLVQAMITPDAAGVCLGADPLTGDRDTRIVAAVRGLGDSLANGEGPAEEWEVVSGQASCRRGHGALTATQAMQVARLLDRVQDRLGPNREMEWALAGGEVHILQLRPMTAIPEQPTWSVGLGGLWLRSIRLGEWLPEPVTPLFDTWLLTSMEDSFRQCQLTDAGFLVPAPLHVLVNGWYYHSPIGGGAQRLLLQGLLRRPRFATAVLIASVRPQVSDRMMYAAVDERWRTDVLPAYRASVDHLVASLAVFAPADLVGAVDDIAVLAGKCFWAMTILGGAAWRAESALARFVDANLKSVASNSVPAMLAGLSLSTLPAHTVQSLDWVRPTLGEYAVDPPGRDAGGEVHRRAVERREATEASCREALAGRGRLLARFELLLQVAQRQAIRRGEVSGSLTYGWPVLRAAVGRLGADLAASRTLPDQDDIYFLTHTELTDAVAGHSTADLGGLVASRRTVWMQQRRLVPPVSLGTASYLLRTLLPRRQPGTAGRQRRTPQPNPPDAQAGELVGVPASPGRASGQVRVLRDPTATDTVRPGEILVVTAAPPALTALFERIAGLCVDGGSVAAHTSLVAREYGLPTIVGLRDASTRLRDGQVVTIDGTTGRIHPLEQLS
jgi:phosphohistidine swiveling domain-containing protein